METQDNYNNDEDAKFENDAVDPGFGSSGCSPLKTREDKREHNIDATMSISEMREHANKAPSDLLKDQPGNQENSKGDDAMNYKSDRENGAYNAKNA